MFWFIVDVIMVVIVLVTTIVSVYRGFVTSFVRVLGVFVSVFVSLVVCRVFSELIFTSLFRQSLVDSIAERIDFTTGLENAFGALETGIIGLILGLFGGMNKLHDFLETAVWRDEFDLAESIVDGVVKNPVVALIKVILFLIAFALISILISLIAKATGIFNTVPVVGGINRFFGGVLGLVYGTVLCLLLASAIGFFIILTGTEDRNIPLINEHSYILSLLMKSKIVFNY